MRTFAARVRLRQTRRAAPRPMTSRSPVARKAAARLPAPLAPAFATQAAPGSLTIGAAGDAHEQQADRVAEQVMRAPESGTQRAAASDTNSNPVVPSAKSTPPIVHDVLRSPGKPLDPATRAFMEPRFGRGFSDVRVHTDSVAVKSADAIEARAFTVGRDIAFGAGEYAPQTDSGRRLLAHELAHVVQQSQNGPVIQPKLKFTGEPSPRVITLLNSGLAKHQVTMDGMGNVSIAATPGKQKESAQQKALADHLIKIIADPKEIVISVSAGSKTAGGTYKTKNIDIADLEVYGVAGLIHEIEEQYYGQKNNIATAGSETQGPHFEGIKAESDVMGAKRGPQSIISYSTNADRTVDAVLEIPFTFPNKTVRVKVLKVVKSNIVSFDWKK